MGISAGRGWGGRGSALSQGRFSLVHPVREPNSPKLQGQLHERKPLLPPFKNKMHPRAAQICDLVALRHGCEVSMPFWPPGM